jgi:hypothetical protein
VKVLAALIHEFTAIAKTDIVIGRKTCDKEKDDNGKHKIWIFISKIWIFFKRLPFTTMLMME